MTSNTRHVTHGTTHYIHTPHTQYTHSTHTVHTDNTRMSYHWESPPSEAHGGKELPAFKEVSNDEGIFLEPVQHVDAVLAEGGVVVAEDEEDAPEHERVSQHVVP